MTRTVKSPAGETVAVYDNAAWERLVNAPRALMLTDARRMALTTLWCEGAITSKAGMVTATYEQLAAKYGYTPVHKSAVNQMLANPAMSSAIHREVRGKRTFHMGLVSLPEAWLKQLPAAAPDEPAVEPEPAVEDVPQITHWTPEEVPAYEPEDEPMEVQVASAVATALLTQVVEIISSGTRSANESWHVEQKVAGLQRDIDMLQARLSQRLEENDKLRRVLRQAQDELAATQQERDGLRGRLKAAEYNLQRALSGDNQKLIMDEVHREIDKMMRAKPASGKDDAA